MTDGARSVRFGLARWLSVLVACLVLAVLFLQVYAEREVRRLCAELGGLRVYEQIAPNSVFAELGVNRADVSLSTAVKRIKQLPASFSASLRHCEESSVCLNVVATKSLKSFTESAPARLLIGWEIPDCRASSVGPRPALTVYAARESRLLGKNIAICEASGAENVLIVTPTAYSNPSANPFRAFVQFRTWAVFSSKTGRPIVSYSQFGVQTLLGKVNHLFSRLTGVPSPDFSANRCDAGQSQGSPVPKNVDLNFNADATYPLGIYLQDTSND